MPAPRNLLRRSLELCDKDDSLVPEAPSVTPYLEISTTKGKKPAIRKEYAVLGPLTLGLDVPGTT